MLHQRPVIKGDNPPPEKLAVSNAYLAKQYDLDHSTFWLFHIGVACIGLLIVIATHSTFLVILMIALAAYLLNVLILKPSKEYGALAAENAKPISLYAYNTEFTTLLADNSIISTNVHFQIPTALSGLVEQLNRVAEKELLIFVSPRTAPPPASEVQDHLQHALVRFQEENQIPVLRAEISTHIHLRKPSKPEGFLYV